MSRLAVICILVLAVAAPCYSWKWPLDDVKETKFITAVIAHLAQRICKRESDYQFGVLFMPFAPEGWWGKKMSTTQPLLLYSADDKVMAKMEKQKLHERRYRLSYPIQDSGIVKANFLITKPYKWVKEKKGHCEAKFVTYYLEHMMDFVEHIIGSGPAKIYLYTYYLPCTCCVDRIIDMIELKLQNKKTLGHEYPFIIGYSSTQWNTEWDPVEVYYKRPEEADAVPVTIDYFKTAAWAAHGKANERLDSRMIHMEKIWPIRKLAVSYCPDTQKT